MILTTYPFRCLCGTAEAARRRQPRQKKMPLVGGKAGGSKMIVVARADEDISYLSLYLPDVPHTVYQVVIKFMLMRQYS